MRYTDNLLGSWTLVNVVTPLYTFLTNGRMYQTVADVQFAVNPRDFRITIDYSASSPSNICIVRIIYTDGTSMNYSLPLSPFETTLQETVPIDEERILTDVYIEIKGSDFVVNTVSLQRSLTDLEEHETNDNPHELPFAITVNSEGIKAIKGEDIMFWLKDTGDADYAGNLNAATGTFAGSVSIGTDTVFAAGYDPSTKVASADVGDMAYEDLVEAAKLGTTIVDGGYIKADLLTADNINVGTLAAARVAIGNDTTFAAGYDPSAKLDSDGVGDMAYEDLVEAAKLGTTIIDGGYIKTSLITIGTETNYSAGYDPSTKLVASDVGDMAFEDLVEAAKLGTTIIDGGYIKADLLTADNINVGTLAAARISIGAETTFATGYDPSDALVEGETYNGVIINATVGFQVTSSDDKARTILNASDFKMQAGDGAGNWTDNLYFDGVAGQWTFTGVIYTEDLHVVGQMTVDGGGSTTGILFKDESGGSTEQVGIFQIGNTLAIAFLDETVIYSDVHITGDLIVDGSIN